MISRQLELGFENQPGMRPQGRNRGRSGRANWWFEKMRGVVDHARDWPAAVPPARAPGSLAPRADASPPASETGPQASTSALPTIEANAPAAPRRYHWRFSRARHMTWE